MTLSALTVSLTDDTQTLWITPIPLSTVSLKRAQSVTGE